MKQLGGQDLSGIGFGLGVDRTMLALRAEGKSVGESARCDVFGVPLSEQAKLTLAVLAGQLRASGVRVDLAYGDRGLKARCVRLTAPVRALRWSPGIATSRRARSG
ncbi:histidyl-tRNA synthetase domain protein [Mycobacterium ulcerans str. Harvey]|uniref:Histidyl-tRNA synthetase domain protein n=1 Tax=Mycobacterium ulcerans str. Harvey TaxID=1299332 RepID=A0ABP3ARA4_MYCUL|nr:histidyl-tRNA synthetase domain protein [Mycobacterium ulcerans str. Harvey]